MYNYYVGDTRGWIRVKKEELERVNLLNSISTSSYVDKDYIYLDEEIDFSFFLYCSNVVPNLNKIKVKDNHFNKYETYKGGLE